MPKPSITGEEIALIKAMLAAGMKNKDIQFFFNRPQRPVNSGRISAIRKDAYANSKGIAPAEEAVLADFIAKHSGQGGSIVVPHSSTTTPRGPLSPEVLTDLFEEVGVGLVWRLRVGETDQHECKANFGMKHAHHWLKPMAGLANNRGGYILFGVYDKSKTDKDGADLGHVVCGIGEEFSKTDPADIANRVKATFDPTPRFETITVVVGGLTVGIMYVEQHQSRPVISLRTDQEVREGEIYYRYAGVSTRIKYSDLRSMLDERDARARAAMVPMIERLVALGPSRAMIADLESGALMDGKATIHIDEALVKKLSFIKEGQFTETMGAPTLRLLGNLTTSTIASHIVKKGVVTRGDIIGDFLSQDLTIDPKESIRFAVEATSVAWVPMRYFAKQAGLNRGQLIAFINSTSAPAERKLRFTTRLKQKDAAYKKVGGQRAPVLSAIEKTQSIPLAKTSKEAGLIAHTLWGLERKTKVPLGVLLRSLRNLSNVAVDGPASAVRRALCRVDEIFFDL